MTLKVTIPVGSDARVMVPRPEELGDITVEESGKTVWENGKYVPGVAGIIGAAKEDSGIAFDVGSGEYSFKLRGQ